MKFTLRNIIEFTTMITIIILSVAIPSVDPLFSILLIIWTACMFYSLREIKKRAMLFAFLISFFIFLIGRDFVKQFLVYKVETLPRNSEVYTWISLIISLITLVLSFNFFSERLEGKDIFKKQLTELGSLYKLSVRQNSLIFFYFSYIFAIISKIAVIIYVKNSSFTQYYIGYSDYLRNNFILYIMSKIEIIMPISWAIYLGTFPKKKEIKFPLFLYVVYLIISLGTGQRSTSMLGLLFLMIYFLFRDREGEVWITKKMVIIVLLSLPFLAFFISFYEVYRQGFRFTSNNIFEGMLKFFYDQGVTSTVVKKAYIYRDFIPDQIYTLEFMHTGILPRLFNIPVYHGNNVEHALYGGSFTHSLSYTIMINSYLSGRGAGSCYIAELFQDFSYPGIILGNIIYGYLIYKISDLSEYKYISNGYKLFIIPFILWAPRGSFTNFISQTLVPSTLITFLFIFTLSYAMIYRYIKAKNISRANF